MRRSVGVLVGILAGVSLACGSSSSTPAAALPASGFFIVISGMAFHPLDLRVPPGGTVTVVNNDGMDHSVTSESTPGAFTKGAVGGVSFDTTPFASGARSFTIPASAAAGTVIPFFCTIHTSTMATPNGAITVDPSAVPTTAPGGGGGGGGGGY